MKLVFETATIAEAIKAAEKVAPAKGQAFDKAAGIVIDIQPGEETVVVRATNTDLYHMAWIDYLELEGEQDTTWRLPSRLFAGFLSTLPIGSGKQVVMQEEVKGMSRILHVTQGRTKARFFLIDHEHYPVWSAFDTVDLFSAPDLGGRIAQVEWAAAKTEAPISGVHFDGENAIATDRYRLAVMPLPIPSLKEPITVPAGILGSILRQTGEVMIGVEDQQLLIMPDEHTQIRSVVYGEKFPATAKIREKFSEQPEYIEFDKDELLAIISRAMHFAGSDRAPTLRLFVGNEELGVMMKDEQRGVIGDIMDLSGQATHDRVELRFTPENLTSALSAAPNSKVRFGYDPEKTGMLTHLDGGSGWEAFIMPRADMGAKSA